MRIAVKTKFHYMNFPTGCYRLHANNTVLTRKTNKEIFKEYKKKAYRIMYSNIMFFKNHNRQKLQQPERELLIRRIMMLLYRPHGSIKMKMMVLPLFVRYFPGVWPVLKIIMEKLKLRNTVSRALNIIVANSYTFCSDITDVLLPVYQV
jgi:hypothetical protein